MKEIDKYMTVNEAAYRWGKNTETVKNKLKPSLNEKEINEMIDEGLIKFFVEPGKQNKSWIISEKAMEKWFGENKNFL